MNLTVRIIAIIVISIGAIGCSESLPFVADPNNILASDVTPRLIVDDNYVSYYEFDVMLVNTYDEVLQAEAKINGVMEIEWKDSPITIKSLKSIPITSEHIIKAAQYDPETNILTLEQGDTLTFRVRWDVTLNDGSDLFNFFDYVFSSCQVRFFRFDDPGNAKVTKPQTIKTKTTIQLFNKRATVQVIKDFQLCFINKFYSNYNRQVPCLKGAINNPCGLIGN